MGDNVTGESESDFPAFKECFSPYAHRLTSFYKIYSYIYIFAFPTFTLVGLAWWFQRSWHPRLAVRGKRFVTLLAFSALCYGLLHSVFIMGEEYSANICALAMFCGGGSAVCFPPMYFLAVVLKKKAEYNKKLLEAIDKSSFSTDSESGAMVLKELEALRVDRVTFIPKALRRLALSELAIFASIVVFTKIFCYQEDGECRFFNDALTRPNPGWVFVGGSVQVGLWKNKIGPDILPHSWGLRQQVVNMPYYLNVLLFFNTWAAFDRFLGNFLDTDTDAEVNFTQFVGIDFGAFLVMGMNIHWQVYKSYDSWTKEKIARLKYEGLTLDQVLLDPVALKAFQNFLVNIQSHENILFYITVKEFLERCKIDQYWNKDKAAIVIYKRFVSTDAQFQVNISYSARVLIEKDIDAINHKKIDYETTFKPAFDEVKGLLGGFCFLEFKQTEEYTALLSRSLSVNNFGPGGLL